MEHIMQRLSKRLAGALPVQIPCSDTELFKRVVKARAGGPRKTRPARSLTPKECSERKYDTPTDKYHNKSRDYHTISPKGGSSP